ncbi:PP2C family protein-serine/threonine phosphatase [Actinoplanes sp. NPDC026670]|uniref:PP2C family protein-serine/threonine phosphatase n=1 Tax=Actinoplanes sp. NPDC026670 TaxID=3154700 RepID=UPI0033F8E6DA
MDFLMAAYRVLGQSLNLQRNARAAVCLPVPVLAGLAALVVTVGPRRLRWWARDPRVAADGPERMPVRAADITPGDLPDWIRIVLADTDGPRVRALGSDGWALPDGGKQHGHGAVVRLPCDHFRPAVLVLLRDQDRAPFDDAELGLAVQYGQAVGRAVTAALLYRDQVQVADALRTALRPAPLPDVAGIELATAYRPSLEAMHISGDIMHVEALPDGGALCVVGDVCGKGIDAAVAGGRLRHSLRILRRVTGEPLEILTVLNNATIDLNGETYTQFSTIVVGSVRAAADGSVLLRLAAGGHLPPLVIRRSGEVETVHIGGMMLGADPNAQFAEAVVWLRPGETCVVYTDGVTEARGPAGAMFGQERLTELLAGYAGMPAAVVAERIEQSVVDWLAEPDHDDIAVLVLRAVPA